MLVPIISGIIREHVMNHKNVIFCPELIFLDMDIFEM